MLPGTGTARGGRGGGAALADPTDSYAAWSLGAKTLSGNSGAGIFCIRGRWNCRSPRCSFSAVLPSVAGEGSPPPVVTCFKQAGSPNAG